MRVAILYICTGKYNIFFPDFYKSSMDFFLAGFNKTYFVWTDDVSIGRNLSNVRIYHKECLGFPEDSLFRFETFLQEEDELKHFDYIYFFNSNALFLKPVGLEILPDESGLAMGVWGGKEAARHPMFYSYERNKESKAYIRPYGKNYKLFMGGLNGGSASSYLEMCHVLSKNIRDDYQRGIIAIAHDQSHINAYLRKHNCKVIGPEYCWPEEWYTRDFEPYMIFRDKVKLDIYFNKNRNVGIMGLITRVFKLFVHAVRWYLYI